MDLPSHPPNVLCVSPQSSEQIWGWCGRHMVGGSLLALVEVVPCMQQFKLETTRLLYVNHNSNHNSSRHQWSTDLFYTTAGVKTGFDRVIGCKQYYRVAWANCSWKWPSSIQWPSWAGGNIMGPLKPTLGLFPPLGHLQKKRPLGRKYSE